MINVGDWVHGHVRGALGRDWYQCARVEHRGPDYVVLRAKSGAVGLVTEDRFDTLAASRDGDFDSDWCKGDYLGGCAYNVNWDLNN